MKMYKCPDCGKVSTSMYCDVCEKAIPANCAASMFDGGASVAANESFDRLTRLEDSNNYLLSRIETHTHVMAVITVISTICAVGSALVTVFSLMKFL